MIKASTARPRFQYCQPLLHRRLQNIIKHLPQMLTLKLSTKRGAVWESAARERAAMRNDRVLERY